MSMSDSTTLSWARQTMLWIQVYTFLRHAGVDSEMSEKIKVSLFNTKYLQSVTITAKDASGYCVSKFALNIDWVRHDALLSQHAIVDRMFFEDDQQAYGVKEFTDMIVDYFSTTRHTKGWGFAASIDFNLACSVIGATIGSPLRNHPNLKRVKGIAIPGLEEAVIELWSVD